MSSISRSEKAGLKIIENYHAMHAWRTEMGPILETCTERDLTCMHPYFELLIFLQHYCMLNMPPLYTYNFGLILIFLQHYHGVVHDFLLYITIGVKNNEREILLGTLSIYGFQGGKMI